MGNHACRALLLASFASCFALAQAPPTAEEVLARYIEASGGEEAFKRVNTVIMRGSMEIKAQNIKADVLIYRADGGKGYSVIDIPGMGKQEEGSDGDVVWEKTALGPRIKTGVEKFLVTCAGEAMSEYARVAIGKDGCYNKVEFAGADTVKGKPVWKLKLTPKMGKLEEQFFDQASGLLVQQKMTMPSPLGEIPITLVLEDYKPIDGLQTPLKASTVLGPVEMAMSFTSIEFNAKIPEQIFAVPPEIAALAAADKKKAPAAAKP